MTGSHTVTLEQQIRALADKTEITEMIAKYSFYAAAAEGDKIADLFTDDGCFEAGAAVIKGKKELREFFRSSLVPGRTVPILGGIFVDLKGDEAEAHSLMATSWFDGPGGFGGRYDDGLRREGAGWLFVRRRYSFYYGITPPVLK